MYCDFDVAHRKRTDCNVLVGYLKFKTEAKHKAIK